METIAKINKTKSWFFENRNNIDKSLAIFTEEKKEKTHINKMKNEKEVTIDSTEIQSNIRD